MTSKKLQISFFFCIFFTGFLPVIAGRPMLPSTLLDCNTRIGCRGLPRGGNILPLRGGTGFD